MFLSNQSTTDSLKHHKMDRIFSEYIKKVQEITADQSPRFYTYIRNVFRSELLKTPPSEVNGIIVGLINYPSMKDKDIYMSTGHQLKKSELKGEMLQQLSTVSDKANILWIRVPMVASFDKHKIQELIEAFHPVIGQIFKIIMRASANDFESPIPVLCLGKNSHNCVIEGLKYINRPRFILLPTVHPNNMPDMEEKISKATCKYERLHLIRRKYYNMDMFNQVFKIFVNLTSSS